MKILLREANWLGDAVMTIPSLTALHDRYPDAKMVVAAKDTLLALFNLLPWSIETIPLGSMSSWPGLRKEKFDLAVIFPNSFRSALEVFLTHARKRIGYAFPGRRLFLTEPVPVNKDIQHQADYYYNILSPLGIRDKRPAPQLLAREKDKKSASGLLKERGVNPENPLIAISPGASYGEAKRWPEENFARLIQELKGCAEIIFTGTKKDAGPIERIISISKTRPVRNKISNGVNAFNLAGETSLSQLAGLFSMSKLVISNDNGAMHLASLLGAPVIAIFGPTDPIRTGPLGQKTVVLRDRVDCAPCKKRICHDKKCFSKITVNRVYDAARGSLKLNV